MWPFTKKSRLVNPGPINEDWRVGDLAECMVDGGADWQPSGRGPEKGDICRVTEVYAGTSPIRKSDYWFLRFASWEIGYSESDFRKVPPLSEATSAEITAMIKRKKPVKA